MKTALILVAGLGSRLRSVTHDSVPKGGLSLEGTGLVDLSLSRLKAVGVKQVILVTGHQKKFFEALAQEKSSETFKISCIENPLYAVTGSMASLYCAHPLIEQYTSKNDSFFMLEGDLIYETEALRALKESENSTSILLSEDKHYEDDYYFEILDQKLGRFSDSHKEYNHFGELTGINKLSVIDYKRICDIFITEKNAKLGYEYALELFAQSNTLPFTLKQGLIWAEIDDADHLCNVEKNIIPALKAKNDFL